MGSLMSRIRDDIAEYEELCRLYGETPDGDWRGVDPYCAHAKALRQRHEEEFEESCKRK